MTKQFYISMIMVAAIQLLPIVASSQTASPNEKKPVASVAPLSNDDVSSLLKSGFAPEIVVAKINVSTCDFNTSATALKELKTSGVPDSVILAMVQAPRGSGRIASVTSGAQLAPTRAQPGQSNEILLKGCIAVKPIGSHAFRNVLLFGAVGAFISHEQYQVVDVVDYPSRLGAKYHGSDLQTIQSSGTRVVLLEKRYTAEELHTACH